MMPKAAEVVRIQENVVRLWHKNEAGIASWQDACAAIAPPKGPVEALAASIALINTYQWHEEDKARDIGATDALIAQIKRNIDHSNQRRVNEIEKLDLVLEDALKNKSAKGSSRVALNSETPGSMVDRISILVLKIHHMDEQSRRKDASPAHRQKCAGKAAVMREQLVDLSGCLDQLVKDIRSRKRRFKTYYQFKMYNDPDTNPYMRAK